MSGLEVLRHVRAEFPSVRVLMLSIYPERQYAVRCLKEGALGYLTKDAVADELVTALRTVSKGKRYVTARLGEVLAATVGPKGGLLPHERLSAREFEIFRLIGRGKTLVEIADVLAVKPSTISTHRSHILAKMRCRSTAQLVRYAVEHGLVDWHP
jgi:DNA-binding NarL/FixJ family response regulator